MKKNKNQKFNLAKSNFSLFSLILNLSINLILVGSINLFQTNSVSALNLGANGALDGALDGNQKAFGELLSSLEPADVQLVSQELKDSSVQENGNWYEKLQWWKKAKPIYEQLKELVAKVQNSKNSLLQSKKNIDDQITRFLSNLRISLAELNEKVAEQLAENSKMQNELEETASEHTEAEQAEFLKVSNDVKNLELVKKPLELLYQYKLRSNEIANVINQQASSAVNNQEKALDSFEKIEQIFDDLKARLLFELIENCYENTQAIAGYLDNDLKNYLRQITGDLNRIISTLNQTIKNLEGQDIVLRNLSPQEIEAKANLAKQEKIAKEKAKKAAEEKAKAQASWWSRLVNWFANLFGSSKSENTEKSVANSVTNKDNKSTNRPAKFAKPEGPKGS